MSGVLVLAGAALLAAGCGGSSSAPGVAHLSASANPSAGGSPSFSETGAPTQQRMVAFSQCMRADGVPGFPEPTEGHLLIRVGGRDRLATGVDPRSARFQEAWRRCGNLLSNGGANSPALQAEAQAAALRFSQCMRTHGLPDFPDPTFAGNAVQLKGVGGAGGIEPSSPQFKAAQRKCQSSAPKLRGAKGGPPEGGAISAGGPKGGAANESGGNTVVVP